VDQVAARPYAARDGSPDVALNCAKTLRDLDPENAQRAATLRQLERGKP